MKIIHVITTIEMGGAENQLVVLVREQIALGHEVTIIFLKGREELESTFNEIGASIFSDCANKNPIWQIVVLSRLFRRTSHDSVIHAHLPRAELLCALAFPKKRFVVSRHNMEPFFPSAPAMISKYLSRLVVCRAKKVIAISKSVAEYLQDSGELGSSKIPSVVHYGYYPNLQTSPKKQVGNLVGTVSRLVPQKDLGTLIMAINLIRLQGIDLKLEIYGEGPEKGLLEKKVSDLSLRDAVRFMGKNSEIPKVIQNFDIFVLSSKYEGFGLVLLEAMANCVPIVSSNSQAAVEVLGVDFPNYFPVGDSEQLSKKILQVLYESRIQTIDYQRERLNNFSPKEMTFKIMKLYMQA